jgi:uncharacterized protein with FMN-binding domain
LANPKDRVTNNLVALGSAAVFTVYAAGFVRTRPAAQRFAQQAERRPAPATRIAAETPASSPTSIDRGETPTPSGAAAPETTQTTKRSSGAKTTAHGKRSTTASSSNVEATQATDSSPAPASVASPTPAQAPDSSRTSTAPTAPDSARGADKEKPRLKDGIFFGWGTSRHGDIQAGIEIKNGRIVSAFINECLTQYSCSWISMLPPQVIARQSPEVDYVSGATQSANAFYYAVADALKKAK